MKTRRRDSGAPARGGLGALIGFLAIPLTVALLAGRVSAEGTRGWYQTISKPELTPPDWVFGPVWTVLYITMGVAAYLVWRRGRTAPGVRPALVAFGVQLLLNGFWSIFFFGMRAPGLAFADIGALWLAIVLTTLLFYRLSRPAGLLMLPYLAWVSFAAALNFSIWRLNG